MFCHDKMILPGSSEHFKYVIRYGEVSHGRIDDINEKSIIYLLLRRCPPPKIAVIGATYLGYCGFYLMVLC